MVLIAHHNGMTSNKSMPSVITKTAGARRLPKVRSKALSQGHVATTIIVAQTVAAKKGLSTQKHSPIKPTTKMAARVLRVRSCFMSAHSGVRRSD
jgi:hypothetical protein